MATYEMGQPIDQPAPGVLEMRREPIDVTSGLPTMDPDWRYTDKQGHGHYYDRSTPTYYPTLVTVVDGTYWCDTCREEHEETHLECPICGETVVPGTRPPSAFREFVPGPAEYFLDGVPISPERYRELMEQRQAEAEAEQTAKRDAKAERVAAAMAKLRAQGLTDEQIARRLVDGDLA
jgi:hypothetical protein